jgi:hypothetical protein
MQHQPGAARATIESNNWGPGMKNMAMILAVLAVVMIIVLGWRVGTGGPAGPKTYGFAVATVAVIIAAVMSRRRRPEGAPPATR